MARIAESASLVQSIILHSKPLRGTSDRPNGNQTEWDRPNSYRLVAGGSNRYQPARKLGEWPYRRIGMLVGRGK